MYKLQWQKDATYDTYWEMRKKETEKKICELAVLECKWLISNSLFRHLERLIFKFVIEDWFEGVAVILDNHVYNMIYIK